MPRLLNTLYLNVHSSRMISHPCQAICVTVFHVSPAVSPAFPPSISCLCRDSHANGVGCSSFRVRSSGSRQSSSAPGKAAAMPLINGLRRKFR